MRPALMPHARGGVPGWAGQLDRLDRHTTKEQAMTAQELHDGLHDDLIAQ